MSFETWRSIEGNYEVSSLGRVRGSTRQGVTYLKPSVSSRGYEIVTLLVNKKRKSCSVHKQRFFGDYKIQDEAYEVARQEYYKMYNTYPWSNS